MASQSRPISPHLQIYKPQLTSVLSITHRGTGVLLSLGGILLVYWLSAAAAGREPFDAAQNFFRSIPGRLILFAIAYSFFYHVSNGVRHLFWDIGKGLEIETARRSGWLVVAASLVLTLLAYLIAYGVIGGVS